MREAGFSSLGSNGFFAIGIHRRYCAMPLVQWLTSRGDSQELLRKAKLGALQSAGRARW